ncbi:hypothetical protein EfmAA96_01210 [Enterococcus faecium]|nr:hypothetical protein EfmAA96_01210 [Enterococcus faecium]
MLQSGGGIWSYAAPKHTLEGVAIKDMESSDQVRKNPVKTNNRLLFGSFSVQETERRKGKVVSFVIREIIINE